MQSNESLNPLSRLVAGYPVLSSRKGLLCMAERAFSFAASYLGMTTRFRSGQLALSNGTPHSF